VGTLLANGTASWRGLAANGYLRARRFMRLAASGAFAAFTRRPPTTAAGSA
jgi:hypothetical protein